MKAQSWDTKKSSIFDKRKMRAATPGEVAVTLRDLRRKKRDEDKLLNLCVPQVVKDAELPCSASFLYKLEGGSKPHSLGPWRPWNKVRLAKTIAALAVYYNSSVEAIMEREVE